MSSLYGFSISSGKNGRAGTLRGFQIITGNLGTLAFFWVQRGSCCLKKKLLPMVSYALQKKNFVPIGRSLISTFNRIFFFFGVPIGQWYPISSHEVKGQFWKKSLGSQKLHPQKCVFIEVTLALSFWPQESEWSLTSVTNLAPVSFFSLAPLFSDLANVVREHVECYSINPCAVTLSH